MNLTTTTTMELPVYGLPGYRFDLIHGSAMTSLLISIICSTGVLIYLLRPVRNFFTRPIGDRLVIYLAACDLLFSISHSLDHGYMLFSRGHPPEGLCIGFAFCVNQFILGQTLVIFFTAVNAFSLVVLEKKINIGKYDWKLLLYALGLPAVFNVVALATSYFGPSGAWCYIDMREKYGPLVFNVMSVLMLVTFAFNIIAYFGIWLKIRQVMHAQAGTGSRAKYIRTARVMMLFVAAYLIQWWAFVAWGMWTIVEDPHVSVYWAAVSFSNNGGLFNFFAYTFIRRKYQKVSDDKKGTNGATTLNTLNTKSTACDT